MDAIGQQWQLDYYRDLAKGRTPHIDEDRLQDKLRQLQLDKLFIIEANKGSENMDERDKQRVRKIAEYQWRDSDDKNHPLLTAEDIQQLCIHRGTLTDEERKRINNHINVSIEMLDSLPFPKNLRRVPEYAGGHHEKMDGSGFPKGLTRQEMSIPARIMAIADIFEALTSQDRPYKQPMKLSQALAIMKDWKDKSHIDPDLYSVFLQQRVWQRYAQEHLMPEQLDVIDITPYR